ncbi:uncharacterized protein QIL1 [Venturia canescens]|uniref:uncharacterized protein QIL1 n=1 Tax=Venturia canescens TaxID=32260 RepID=UPI001C9D431E|nr:uncharacterized protein LOC122409664 [Venturia canescens]
MKRSAKTIARTINLSQPKSCERPSPVRKLVSADIAEPCPTLGNSYQTPRPVTVRICTRKQLERTCPPKLCDCPPKDETPAGRKIIGTWAKLLSKGAIAGGLVYWTSAEGVWGDSTETEDLYYRIVATVAPVLPELPDLQEMKLPHLESVKHTIYEAYNHFVCSAIGGLVEIPSAIKDKVMNALFPCDNSDEDKLQDSAEINENS